MAQRGTGIHPWLLGRRPGNRARAGSNDHTVSELPDGAGGRSLMWAYLILVVLLTSSSLLDGRDSLYESDFI